MLSPLGRKQLTVPHGSDDILCDLSLDSCSLLRNVRSSFFGNCKKLINLLEDRKSTSERLWGGCRSVQLDIELRKFVAAFHSCTAFHPFRAIDKLICFLVHFSMTRWVYSACPRQSCVFGVDVFGCGSGPFCRSRRRPPQADVDACAAKCSELRRSAAEQEQQTPVSFSSKIAGLPQWKLTNDSTKLMDCSVRRRYFLHLLSLFCLPSRLSHPLGCLLSFGPQEGSED